MNTASHSDIRTNRPRAKDDKSPQNQQQPQSLLHQHHYIHQQHQQHQQLQQLQQQLPPQPQQYHPEVPSSFSSSSRSSSSGFLSYPSELGTSYERLYVSASGTTSSSLHSLYDHDDLTLAADYTASFDQSTARPMSTHSDSVGDSLHLSEQPHRTHNPHPPLQQSSSSFTERPHLSDYQHPSQHLSSQQQQQQRLCFEHQPHPSTQNQAFPAPPYPSQHEQPQEQQRQLFRTERQGMREQLHESDEEDDDIDDDDNDDDGFDLELDLDPEQLQHPLLLGQQHLTSLQVTSPYSSSSLPQEEFQPPLLRQLQQQQQHPSQQSQLSQHQPRPQSYHELHSNNFITEDEFLMLADDYLLSLSPKKREKALLSNAMYQKILMVLLQPKNTQVSTAQFRFWAKKMFTLSTTATHHIVCHGAKPVATKECLYDVLVYCHRKSAHGGRDKTSAEVRLHYSWVPKELIARFVKHCPLCSSRRHSLQRPLSSLGIASGRHSSSRLEHPSGQYLVSQGQHHTGDNLYQSSAHTKYSAYPQRSLIQSQQAPPLPQQKQMAHPSSQQSGRQDTLQSPSIQASMSHRRHHDAGPFRHGYRRSSHSDSIPLSSRSSILQSPYSSDSYPGREWSFRSQLTDDTGPGEESEDDDEDLLADDDNEFNDTDKDSWPPSFLKHHSASGSGGGGGQGSRGGSQQRPQGKTVDDIDDDEFTPSGMVGIPQEVRSFSSGPPTIGMRQHPHRAASFDLHSGLRSQQQQQQQQLPPLSMTQASSYHYNPYHHNQHHQQQHILHHRQGSQGPGQLQHLLQDLRPLYPDAPLPVTHHPNEHLIHSRHPIHDPFMSAQQPGFSLEYVNKYSMSAGTSAPVNFQLSKGGGSGVGGNSGGHHEMYRSSTPRGSGEIGGSGGGTMQRSASTSGYEYASYTRQCASSSAEGLVNADAEEAHHQTDKQGTTSGERMSAQTVEVQEEKVGSRTGDNMELDREERPALTRIV